jgi:hypothetical protein
VYETPAQASEYEHRNNFSVAAIVIIQHQKHLCEWRNILCSRMAAACGTIEKEKKSALAEMGRRRGLHHNTIALVLSVDRGTGYASLLHFGTAASEIFESLARLEEILRW